MLVPALLIAGTALAWFAFGRRSSRLIAESTGRVRGTSALAYDAPEIRRALEGLGFEVVDLAVFDSPLSLSKKWKAEVRGFSSRPLPQSAYFGSPSLGSITIDTYSED